MTQLYDVCIMRTQQNGVTVHVSTPHYNLPYPLASRLGKNIAGASNQPKGTFHMVVKNGVQPLRQLMIFK